MISIYKMKVNKGDLDYHGGEMNVLHKENLPRLHYFTYNEKGQKYPTGF